MMHCALYLKVRNGTEDCKSFQGSIVSLPELKMHQHSREGQLGALRAQGGDDHGSSRRAVPCNQDEE